MTRQPLLIAVVLGVSLISCAARLPTLEEVNEVVLRVGFSATRWHVGTAADLSCVWSVTARSEK